MKYQDKYNEWVLKELVMVVQYNMKKSCEGKNLTEKDIKAQMELIKEV